MMDNLISYSTILYEQIACVEDKQTELVRKLIKTIIQRPVLEPAAFFTTWARRFNGLGHELANRVSNYLQGEISVWTVNFRFICLDKGHFYQPPMVGYMVGKCFSKFFYEIKPQLLKESHRPNTPTFFQMLQLVEESDKWRDRQESHYECQVLGFLSCECDFFSIGDELEPEPLWSRESRAALRIRMRSALEQG